MNFEPKSVDASAEKYWETKGNKLSPVAEDENFIYGRAGDAKEEEASTEPAEADGKDEEKEE